MMAVSFGVFSALQPIFAPPREARWLWLLDIDVCLLIICSISFFFLFVSAVEACVQSYNSVVL